MNKQMTLLMSGAISLAACNAPPATAPAARPVPAEVVLPEPRVSVPANWTARGQEPGWLLAVAGDTADFTYDYGAQTYSALLPRPKAIAGGFSYSDERGGLAITSIAKVCADSATGVPYPDTVTVTLGGQVYTGCGGEPDTLLAGGDWVVVEINGADLIEGTRIFLAFDPAEGRVSGRGGCNSYGADYSVGGEGIAFGQVVSTEMACPDEILAQEGRFYAALAGAIQHTFDEAGALVLTGARGSRIVARKN